MRLRLCAVVCVLAVLEAAVPAAALLAWLLVAAVLVAAAVLAVVVMAAAALVAAMLKAAMLATAMLAKAFGWSRPKSERSPSQNHIYARNGSVVVAQHFNTVHMYSCKSVSGKT